ncbi:MAG: glycoside hydrolase family 76 protein [Elusimicrobia bacterium]|nr:glycoside hydrolase family 76 protein [Elusimicrobiota bacterium]
MAAFILSLLLSLPSMSFAGLAREQLSQAAPRGAKAEVPTVPAERPVALPSPAGPQRKAPEGTPASLAATALMQLYDARVGNWPNHWWTAANALTAMIDHMSRSGDERYLYVIDRTFSANQGAQGGDFTNSFIDDTGWWGLAWVRAYDLTKNSRYLAMAERDADYMYGFWDKTCGGGVWWSADKTYKNAISNELFLKLAASLHNRIPGDAKYLDRARRGWTWFAATGMINAAGLVNDGLDSSCRNNGQQTWTYNQGVVLGGLAELYRATGDKTLLTAAGRIADAATTSAGLVAGGVLTEPCGSDCRGDAPAFKGIFVRNLSEFSRIAGSKYDAFLSRQATSLWTRACDAGGRCGSNWSKPFDFFDVRNQQSALDVLNAAP